MQASVAAPGPNKAHNVLMAKNPTPWKDWLRTKKNFDLVRAALLPVLATALVWTPQIVSSIPAVSGISKTSEPELIATLLLLLVLYFSCAPATALIVNWRWPAATDKDRATYAALPQLLVSPALVAFHVWLEVQRGYLLEDSGEEAMSYGIGVTLAFVAGIILTILVAAFGRLGAWLGSGRQDSLTHTGAASRPPALHGGRIPPGEAETLGKGKAAIALSAVGSLVVIIASLVIVVPQLGHNSSCSEAEQRALSEFPQYGGSKPNWQSEESIGGCSTSYTAGATPEEILQYYQVGLGERGWSVVLAQPHTTSIIYFDADREGLYSRFKMEGATSPELGQTRVFISGGERP